MSDKNAQQSLEGLRAELARSQQQLADMAAAQEEFLRAVSHDLRAPLRHVTSYGSLVQEILHNLSPPAGTLQEVQEAQGFLATMDQSARRMGQMLDGLLALAQASRAPLQCAPVPLQDAIAQARAALAHASDANRPLDWRIAPDLPTLHADPTLLRQLLVQLLGNAMKFTRHTAAPHISVQARETDGAYLLQVQDNGAGFDPARASGLFGVFQRLHRESEFEGVGTGLALCQRIVQRHGGRISAEGAVGQGCVVQVWWPLQAATT